MKSIEEKLQPLHFMRVHKSFVVNLNKIDSIRNLKISIGPTFVPVSEQYADDLLKKINR
jgi:two-component system, LytTR family, response regulator